MKKIIQNIFDKINQQTLVTEKQNVINYDEFLDDKVYTKKIIINKPFNSTKSPTIDTIQIISVSLTSNDKDMNDVTPNNIRINAQNNKNIWINIFINEATNELINFINENI